MPRMKKPARGLPVHGYHPQSADAVALVNHNKITEEKLLREMDLLAQSGTADHSWLVLAKQHLEQAFMCWNRAIFKPQRVKLAGD